MIETGGERAQVLFISDYLRATDQATGLMLSGHRRDLLVNACKRAGLAEGEYAFMAIHPVCPPSGKLARLNADMNLMHRGYAQRLILEHPANVLVPLGEYALKYVTGLSGILKHHCTIMKARATLGGRKCIPLIEPDAVMKDFVLSAYTSFGVTRIKAEMHTKSIEIAKRTFHTEQAPAYVISFLERAMKCEELAIDVEASAGNITVIGIAISPHEAIAIDVRAKPLMLEHCRSVLEGPARKILHNFTFDDACLRDAGIRLSNIYFDTMLAMKLLHPELEKGLDNAARIYTRLPYWKDDGHDWQNPHNWRAHLEYNCCDTTATFAAYQAQGAALAQRQLREAYDRLIMGAAQQVSQMCTLGMRIDQDVHAKLSEQAQEQISHYEKQVSDITLERFGERINSRSAPQLRRTLKELDIEIPKEKGKETVSSKALKTLIRKHPQEPILPALIKLNSIRHWSERLDRIRPDREGRVRYLIDACYNEFGEWAGYNDIRDRGCYPPDLPRKLRSIFIADSGSMLIQASLPDAEISFISYDAPEPRLITLLANGESPGRYFASHIWQNDAVNKTLARIGSKTLLRIAYGIGPRQLMELFSREHQRTLTLQQSKAMIAKCYELFPGIRRRQMRIEQEIRRCKRLTTPMGRERIFYDRIGDPLFRQAFQYAPRSTVADAVTQLMLSVKGCDMLLHGNDYLLMQAVERPELRIEPIKLVAGMWTPQLKVETGQQWSDLHE